MNVDTNIHICHVKEQQSIMLMTYSKNGTFKECYVKEINIKRRKYDQFQNISCPAISLSKLTCNTNVKAILPGTVAQYYFKYMLKNTKEKDTGSYENVLIATKKYRFCKTKSST